MRGITLTQGMDALVDDDNYAKLNAHKWRISKSGKMVYAVREIRDGKKQNAVYMHRVIMNAPRGLEVDHIDGNGLNNQKANLRVITHRANPHTLSIMKKSRFVGVSWEHNTTDKHWKATIRINGKTKYLGHFRTEGEAHQKYFEAIPH